MWFLIALLLILLAGAVVLWPFLRPQPVGAVPATGEDPRLAELYSQRDMLYQAIRDARFDLQTGKLSQEDYDQQAARLKQNAAAVLRQIDQLETQLVSPKLDAEIEAEVMSAREIPPALKKSASNGEVKRVTRASTDRFCGRCGASLRPNDVFCGKCGAPVDQ
ncbi:MAG TPA: zinc-ribbon domain-containing protein [Caldilineae bacterium]|nr:zinc-ribbon domain-containing protein [Caldilineae bacterium]